MDAVIARQLSVAERRQAQSFGRQLALTKEPVLRERLTKIIPPRRQIVVRVCFEITSVAVCSVRRVYQGKKTVPLTD
jgi:hypothetical protein